MRVIRLLQTLFIAGISFSTFADFAAQDFFKAPDMLSAQMSPSGQRIATIRLTPNGSNLMLLDSTTLKESLLLDVNQFSMKDASIRALRWIDEHHIAAQFMEVKKGVKDLLDTRSKRHLLIIKISEDSTTPPTVLSVRTRGWMIDPLPAEEGVFLYAKGGIYSKVYKVNVAKLLPHKKRINKLTKIDGGQFKKSNEVVSLEGYVTRWFSDLQGNPVAALYFNKERKLALASIEYVDGEQKVSELKTWEQLEERDKNLDSPRILPIAMGPEPSVFYCLDFSEDEERSVYKVNYQTGEQQLIYESDSYSIVDLIINDATNLLSGVRVLEDGEVRNVYFELDQSAEEALSKTPRTQIDAQISQNLAQTQFLHYTENHTQSGQYVLNTDSSEKSVILGSEYPHLDGKLNSQLIEDTVRVEELDIPYLLSLPQGENQNLPLILMPHGGPTGVFDDRYFDLPTQFFVANGFAVLRVNFRGSGGISAELREAGKRQWGGLMIEDLYQATRKVLEREDINSQQVCAFGMSYGGYAATKLVLEYPDVYKCAVTVAGVSDINLFITKSDISKQQKRWLKENVGDFETEFERLKSESPLYDIHNLTRPLLIMHGAKDERVDIEQAYRLKRVLDLLEIPYQWRVFPEGEHSFGTPEQSAELFDTAIEFIANEIKGS